MMLQHGGGTQGWKSQQPFDGLLVASAPMAGPEELFALAPEVVVLSTGATQRFPRAALRAEFATRKIGMEVMEIGAACRTYNVLVGEERRVLAAVLLPG